MNREQILANLRAAPPSGGGRVDYFHEIYAQITGWITGPDREWLCDNLPEIALAYPHEMRVVEVGTFGGSTARGLIALTGGRITSMDNWTDFHAEDAGVPTGPDFFWKNIRTYGPDLSSRVDALITGNSREIGIAWNKPIDLLLVDGDHSYEGALADLQNFAKHVVQGGYCLVDDYDMPFVQRACEAYFTPNDWETIRRPEPAPAHLLCMKRL